MKQTIGLFIGRFQPFHLGHIDALKQARKYGITEFIIGVGSSNKEHTAENPFTYEERKVMITKILNALGVKFTIYPLPDVESDDDWKNYAITNLPKFDVVISGNTWTTGIFKKAKYKICNIKISKDIKSIAIRHMLHIGDMEGMKTLVPGQVIIYLQSMKADKRLAKYYRDEHIGPALAVDGILVTKEKKIVIIQRKNIPLGYALPGGFVDYGETTEQALIREMKEEIGVHIKIRRLAGVMSDPKRDPRGHIISIVYIADIVS
jgi:nicotinamide-nucleotide adenylyltransferase